MLIAVVILGRFSIGLGRACGAPKGHCAGSRAANELGFDREVAGLLGTVEKYQRPARQGGRYKLFMPDFASLALWPCGQHAVLDAPTTRPFHR